MGKLEGISRAPDFTPEEIRRMEDDDAEQGVEFEIVTGPPYPEKGVVSGHFFWRETPCRSPAHVHVAPSLRQAMYDRREYILEVLSA